MPYTKDLSGRTLVTRSSLVCELRQSGIFEGDAVCVHASLSKLGYVCGAGQTVLNALFELVGNQGSIMMPAFTGENSDPVTWKAPPVPQDWIDPIRNETPPYDKRLTPTRHMGAVAELFRIYPGVLRSDHPHSSFAAWGRCAEILVGCHPLEYRFGPHSPLGKLAAINGKVLLLGAGADRASFVYLAQFMSGIGDQIVKEIPLPHGVSVSWKGFNDFAVNNLLVSTGVEYLIETGVAKVSSVGDGSAITLSVRPAIEALLQWGWKTVDVPNRPTRPPTPIPKDWSVWL
jgi:aminoglycoside 3-N-acetyltransferase